MQTYRHNARLNIYIRQEIRFRHREIKIDLAATLSRSLTQKETIILHFKKP